MAYNPRIQSERSLPRPLEERYDDFLGTYTAMPGQVPLPVQSQFIVREHTVSSPRQLRLSCTYIGISKSMQGDTGLPVAALWHPLSEQELGDTPIPLVSYGAFRCARCGAYINPNFKFLEGGKKIQCNICEQIQKTPDIYFHDRSGKPELYAGTCDFVSEHFEEFELFFFICIDTSGDTHTLQQTLLSIKSLLDYLPRKCRLGFMTYNSVLTFYKFGTTDLTAVVVSDTEDPFVPDSVTALTLNVDEDRDKLEILIDRLLSISFLFTHNPAPLISVLKSLKLLMVNGGRVLLFSSQPKNSIIPKDTIRPNEEYFAIAQECAEIGICIDIFSSYKNAVTLAAICSQTGGDLYIDVKGEELYYLILRILTRFQSGRVMMRARVSRGLKIESYIGKFRRRSPLELQVAAMDSDKSILIVIDYDDTLSTEVDYYLQCAILHTNQFGQRLIRVTNTVIQTTQNSAKIFRGADCEVLINAYLKIYAASVYESRVQEIREKWLNNLFKMLKTHQVALQEAVDWANLVLPKSLLYLPLFCNSAMKFPAFSLSEVDMDQRMHNVHFLISLTLLKTRLLVYPSVYSIHDLLEQPHLPGSEVDERIKLPTLVPALSSELTHDGIYLVNDGIEISVLVGEYASSEIIKEIWGLENVEDLKNSPEYWEFQDIHTEYSQRVLRVVEEMRRRTMGPYLSVKFFFGKNKVMAEDHTSTEHGYRNFLQMLHKRVLNQ